MIRLTALIALAAVVALAAPAAARDAAADAGPQFDLVAIGPEDAGTTAYAYLSPTCPHCAEFYRDSLPELEAALIAPGALRLVVRGLPSDPVALAVAAMMVIDCAPDSRAAADHVFLGQDRWLDAARAGDARSFLVAAGAAGGLSEAESETCLADQARAQALYDAAGRAAQAFELSGVPGFVIDGRAYAAHELARLDDWREASGAPDAAVGPAIETLWTLDGLDAPESAALSADGDFLYVSNVAGEGAEKNGEGHVSRVSLDGEMLEDRWAEGLDAPKGVYQQDGRLYVADIDRLVVLDAESGDTLAVHAAEGAGFLNDVGAAPDGPILVSDSANARIYGLGPDGLGVWLEDARLDGVNGLLAHDGALLITTMTKGALLRWTPDGALQTIASGMENADGVAVLAGGGFLVTAWPGELYHVTRDGAVESLLDTREAPVFLNDILLIDDVLIVPNWQPGRVTAYRVSR